MKRLNKQSLFKLSLTLLSSILILSIGLAGCSSDSGSSSDNTTSASGDSKGTTASSEKRKTVTDFLMPEASGLVVYGDDNVSIDASNTDQGYVMVSVDSSDSRIKVQITDPTENVYTYDLKIGNYETFPLSGGDGTYTVDVLENVSDNNYARLVSQDIDVSLSNEFLPFLYPNQYAWYESGDNVVNFGIKLSDHSSDDLDYLTQVYHYVIENIEYDYDKAETVKTSYLPDVNETFETGKGICWDYASLMTALLRSQKIPTKLLIGYSGTAYHAWISVYLEESGWIDNIISFDGTDWKLMDPTMAASKDEEAAEEYIGDGSNYTVKYTY